MARKKRIWYPGATYHVMNRGNRRTPIFADHEDYLAFLKYIQAVQKKYPFKIHNICLMNNHYHICTTSLRYSVGDMPQSARKAHPRWEAEEKPDIWATYSTLFPGTARSRLASIRR